MAETVAATESVANDVQNQVNGSATIKEDVEIANPREADEVKEENIKTEDEAKMAENGTKTEEGADKAGDEKEEVDLEDEEKSSAVKDGMDVDTTPKKPMREWDVGKDESMWSGEKRKRDRDHDADDNDGHYSKRNKQGPKPRKNDNIKSRFDNKEETDDHDEIRRQVEFYFSDSNLPVDKYLFQQTGGHKNQPVDLKVLANFARMRRFQPYTAVVEALQGSDFLDLETQGNEHMITRKVPLDAEYTDDLEKNEEVLHRKSLPVSIYAKGFGPEERDTHSKIEEFFEVYGVKSVRLRRERNGTFKESVFAEFESEEKMKQFLALNPKPKWEGVVTLNIMTKEDYVDDKYDGDIRQLVIDSQPRPTYYGDKRDPKYQNRRGGKHHPNRGFRDGREGRDERRGGRDGGRDRHNDDKHDDRERRGFKRQRRDRRDDREESEDREEKRSHDHDDKRSHRKRKGRDDDEGGAGEEAVKKTRVEPDKKRKHRADDEDDAGEGAKKAKVEAEEEGKVEKATEEKSVEKSTAEPVEA